MLLVKCLFIIDDDKNKYNFLQIKQLMTQVQKESNLNEFNKFLDNNTDFLQERYIEHFKDKTFKPKQLNRQTTVKYIYDVFSFSKYETDEKLNKTLKTSLTKNIEDFLLVFIKTMKPFNKKTAVQLLRFCIQNNEMFSVKYDKKDKKILTQNNSQITEQEKEKEQSEKQEPKEEKLEQSKIEEKQEPQEKKEPIQKQKQRQLQVKEQSEDQNLVNEFEMSQEKKIIDPDLIKKNLKSMFQFYCKQQIMTGVNSTFDRINHESSTLTLGKMIAFAKLTNIFNDKIDKALVTRKFKLIAQGKKQIQFEKFYDLMNVFSTMDESLIPRLGVDDKDSFKQKLKYIKKPFSTQDTAARQQKRESVFIPILTSHSGKPSDALADQIRMRKIAKVHKTAISDHKNQLTRKSISRSRYDRTRLQQKDKSQIMSPKQLSNSKIQDFDENLRVLEKIVNDDADEEFLKDYKLPTGQIKKQNHLPPRLIPRKQGIVTNLKRRVEQLQRAETRQSVKIEKREFHGKKAFSKGLLLK